MHTKISVGVQLAITLSFYMMVSFQINKFIVQPIKKMAKPSPFKFLKMTFSDWSSCLNNSPKNAKDIIFTMSHDKGKQEILPQIIENYCNK